MKGSILGSPTPTIQGEQSSSAPQFLVFSCIYAYILQRRTTKFGSVANMGKACFRSATHCVCTNASRGFSAIAEFLVDYNSAVTLFDKMQFSAHCLNTSTTWERHRLWAWKQWIVLRIAMCKPNLDFQAFICQLLFLMSYFCNCYVYFSSWRLIRNV